MLSSNNSFKHKLATIFLMFLSEVNGVLSTPIHKNKGYNILLPKSQEMLKCHIECLCMDEIYLLKFFYNHFPWLLGKLVVVVPTLGHVISQILDYHL